MTQHSDDPVADGNMAAVARMMAVLAEVAPGCATTMLAPWRADAGQADHMRGSGWRGVGGPVPEGRS